MRKSILHIVLLFLLLISIKGFSQGFWNGGEGTVGATQLMINPWSHSSALWGSDMAYASGLEAVYMNPAGVAAKDRGELIFNRTNWLQGSQIYLNSFGLSQPISQKASLALAVVAFDIGEIEITTVNNPEGGIGTYKPQFMNIGLTYSRAFDNGIYGGLTAKVISESIHNIRGLGVALDGAVQYISGEKDQISIGVALKNVGPNYSYSGDGLKWEFQFPNGNSQKGQVSAESIQLPTLLNLGAGYRFDFGTAHALQTGFTYSARPSLNDQTRIGVDYGYRKYFNLRLGLIHERGIFTQERVTVFTGPAAGFSLQIPYGKNGTEFGFDYAYRDTNPFGGVHTFGARIIL